MDGDEDEEDEEDDEDEQVPSSSTSANFAVLNSSLPPDIPKSPHHLTSYASAKHSSGKERKSHKPQWHFGIRSRSPPMEIILEIYKTLKLLGMEWKEKTNLGGLAGKRGVRPRDAASLSRKSHNPIGAIERVKDLDGGGLIDLKAASSIYSLETRARVNNVVVC